MASLTSHSLGVFVEYVDQHIVSVITIPDARADCGVVAGTVCDFPHRGHCVSGSTKGMRRRCCKAGSGPSSKQESQQMLKTRHAASDAALASRNPTAPCLEGNTLTRLQNRGLFQQTQLRHHTSGHDPKVRVIREATKPLRHVRPGKASDCSRTIFRQVRSSERVQIIHRLSGTASVLCRVLVWATFKPNPSPRHSPPIATLSRVHVVFLTAAGLARDSLTLPPHFSSHLCLALSCDSF